LQNLSPGSLSSEIDRHWRVSSYSGLVKQGGHTFDDNLGTLQYLDVDSFGDEMQPENIERERSIFSFPKGARPGTFLHTLFEEIEFTLPADTERNTHIISELLESEQMEAEWLPILQNLVDTVLSTPLDGKALRLNQIPMSQRLVEMEFLLPIEVLSSPSLNRVAHRHDMLSAKAGELGFQNTKGMLKGFIDLVFEYQGKYYVLDWKSNYLGNDVDQYQISSINNAMVDHRYDFQYQIYTLALHRFLATRIVNYDYQQHFGGVFYLFVRGMDGSSERGIFSTKPSVEFVNELDALIDGREIEFRQNHLGQTELF
jgi:exodeoxyribonuclease V beta subunit